MCRTYEHVMIGSERSMCPAGGGVRLITVSLSYDCSISRPTGVG